MGHQKFTSVIQNWHLKFFPKIGLNSWQFFKHFLIENESATVMELMDQGRANISLYDLDKNDNIENCSDC